MKNNHILDHSTKEKHALAFNLDEGCLWCYVCKAKINPPSLKILVDMLKSRISKHVPHSDAPAAEIGADTNPEDLEGIIDMIKNGSIKKIAVMSGAGISVSAGIPDFINPDSSLFEKVMQYDLPDPQAVFTLDYFLEMPNAFYSIVQSMIKKYYPTPAHYFIRLLQDKGLLYKCYTQNIDSLEVSAGIREDLLVQAHGKMTSSHCASCHAEVNQELMTQHLLNGEPLQCTKCNGPCKPDVILFGESMPAGFYEAAQAIVGADLVLVIGSSLAISPFSDMIDYVSPEVPRIMINKQMPDEDYDEEVKNVIMVGEADVMVLKLIKMLGWEADFDKLMEERKLMIKQYEEDKAKGIAKPY